MNPLDRIPLSQFIKSLEEQGLLTADIWMALVYLVAHHEKDSQSPS